MKRQKEQSISSFFISDSNSNNSNNSNSPPKSPSKSPTPHSYVPCPICNKPINSEFINLHIDADHLLSNESENIHKKRKTIEANNSNSNSNVKIDTDINENEVGENELEIDEDGDETSSPQKLNDLPSSSSTTLDNNDRNHNENGNEPVTSKTFLSYFKGQVRESSAKYFCLDWGNRKCYFGEKPSWEIKYSCELNWRSERRVIVLVSTIAGLEKNVLQPEVKYKNISFLKSHLQKCIRRSKSKQAVQTALHLLKLNQVFIFIDYFISG